MKNTWLSKTAVFCATLLTLLGVGLPALAQDPEFKTPREMDEYITRNTVSRWQQIDLFPAQPEIYEYTVILIKLEDTNELRAVLETITHGEGRFTAKQVHTLPVERWAACSRIAQAVSCVPSQLDVTFNLTTGKGTLKLPVGTTELKIYKPREL